MWIICAGSKRSGSTLQYNIVSKLVELKGLGKRLPHSKPDEFSIVYKEQKDYNGIKVFKSHILTNEIEQLIANSEAKIVYCYRVIRDVVVSLIKKGWLNRDLKSISTFTESYLSDFDRWHEFHNQMYASKYENFYDDIKTEIRDIAAFLNIDILVSEVNQIVKELSHTNLRTERSSNYIEKGKYIFDKNTLLHENHIQGRVHGQFKEFLNQNEIIAIESIANKWLSSLGYTLYWQKSNKFISLSQHADDYIAWQILGKKSTGLVVEVGAFDGVHLSNSYGLEQLGYKSICIEPNPETFEYLETNRPNAININCAVVGDEQIKEIEFFCEEIGVLSGCDYDEEDVRNRYKNRGIDYKQPQKIKVAAKTLNSLLREYLPHGNLIDLVSIDVEGFELEVLGGFDLNRYQVNLFIIEANTVDENKKIKEFFKKYPAYIFIGNNLQNLFFVRKKGIKKENLRKLNFDNYIRAKQVHPKGVNFVIDSTPPQFQKSKEAIRFEKFLGIL